LARLLHQVVFFFFEGKKIQNKTKQRVCSLVSIMPSVEHIDDNLAGFFCGPEIHLLLCSSTTQEAAAAKAAATKFERRKKSLACDACAVWKGNNDKISNKNALDSSSASCYITL
jgi:hypothetical protein